MIDDLIRNTPGRLGFLLRRIYWQKRLARCGGGLIMSTGVTVNNPGSIKLGSAVCIGVRGFLMASNKGYIKIGDNVSTNSNVRIDASVGGTITIGDNVIIGPNTVLRASMHRNDRLDIPIREQGHIGGVIYVGENVWIGANVFIRENITIGEGAIVGANSVVTHDIEPRTVVGGVPATLIKRRE